MQGLALSGLPSPQFLCTVIAILLHYVYMSTFAWSFVESLHVYRMLTEVRNIDAGPMRFYYVVGWGIPAIVTGEDVQSSPTGVAWGRSDHHSGDPPDLADTGTQVRQANALVCGLRSSLAPSLFCTQLD